MAPPTPPEGRDNSNQGDVASNIHVSAFSAVDKIPPFWKKDPELWFCQIEAVFARAQINNSLTKFQTIIPKIDFDVLEQIADLVKNPSDTPYEDIKGRLVSTYTDSEQRRIQQLLEGKQLGDEKPSQLLRHMKTLAGNVMADKALKAIWTRSLPQNIQTILVSTGQEDLDKMAEIADKIQEVSNRGEVLSVATRNYPSQSEQYTTMQQMVANLEAKVEKLTQQLVEFGTNRESRIINRNKSQRRRDRSNSQSRKDTNSPDWLCYYHFRFREKASKCVSPCAWDRINGKQQGNEKVNRM